MQQTLEELAAQNTAFKQAFDEGGAPPSADDAMTEDERFGIQAEDGQSDAGGEGDAADVAVVIAADAEEGEQPEVVAPTEGEQMEAEVAAGAEAPTVEEAIAEGGGEEAAPPAEEMAAEAAPPAEEPAPTMTYEDAVQRLREDFGDEFVDLIRVVALHEASKAGASAAETAVGGVRKEVDEAIDAINQAFATAHFEAIQEAHEDFLEIVATPEFQAWVDGMDPEGQSQAKGVIAGGTARQVIRLLRDFKSATQSTDDISSLEDMDASAGIRSTGAGAPTLGGRGGAAKDDYESAWANA